MANASTAAAAATSAAAAAVASPNLWDEILDSVSGRKATSRKNLIVLGEPQTGKSTLLSHLLRAAPGGSSSQVKPIALPSTVKAVHNPRLDLAIGYEWVDVRDEGDEETLPPLSIYTPPSSHPSLLHLLPLSLASSPSPATSGSSSQDASSASLLADTAVVIVLDWTKPASMVEQLLTWLEWLDKWAASVAGREGGEENRERLQHHLQHYNEPPPLPSPGTTSAAPNASSAEGSLPADLLPPVSTYIPLNAEVLPLGPGTLTRNPYGVPITIVCTKADQIDVVAEELGFGGPSGVGGKGIGGKGGWEERTDWIGQVLRLVALMYGGSLFYTSQAHPETFSLLRAYLIHRLFSPPPNLLTAALTSSSSSDPPPTTATASSSTRFPYPHRANVLDRDRVAVPAGWDSWGKICVLREGFEPERVTAAWGTSLRRRKAERDPTAGEVDEEEEDVEDLWAGLLPEVGNDPVNGPSSRTTTADLDQNFLARHHDLLQKDPARDPRQSFRTPATSSSLGTTSSLVGVVGPMGGGAAGLSLPGVERAMAEMEGSGGRRGSSTPTTGGGGASSIVESLFAGGNNNATLSRPALPTREYSSSASLTSTLKTAVAGGEGLTSPSASSSPVVPAFSPSLTAGGGSTNGQPPPSTEDLHNFFQSLLTARKSTGVASLAASSSSPANNPATSPP